MSEWQNWNDFQSKKYTDEPRWMTWLAVQRNAIYLLDPEAEDENETELWTRSVAKHGLDEETFNFADTIRARNLLESDHGYYSKSTVEMSVEQTSQHDWTESETVVGKTLQVIFEAGLSKCGGSEANCTDFTCSHPMVVKTIEYVDNVRNEFFQQSTTLADRPDEGFFLGLPGLKYVEEMFNAYKRFNRVCQSCFIMTPKSEAICQNCDHELATIK